MVDLGEFVVIADGTLEEGSRRIMDIWDHVL